MWTLCIEAIGDTLHRYESFEGIPIQIKTEIGNYLTRLGVFSQVPNYTMSAIVFFKHPFFSQGHMTVLLDPEQVRLDITALSGTLTDKHLADIGTLCPKLRIVNLSGCGVADLSFQSLSLCHMLTHFTADKYTTPLSMLKICSLTHSLLLPSTSCPRVDSRMIGDIAKGCPLLTSFSAANCPLLTHSGIMAIGKFFS